MFLKRPALAALAFLLVLSLVPTVSALTIPHSNNQNTTCPLNLNIATRGLSLSPSALEVIRHLREHDNTSHLSPSTSPKREITSGPGGLRTRQASPDEPPFIPKCPTNGGIPTIADMTTQIAYLRSPEIEGSTCEPHSKAWYWCRQEQQEGRWGVFLCRKDYEHGLILGDEGYASIVGAKDGFPCKWVADYLERLMESCVNKRNAERV